MVGLTALWLFLSTHPHGQLARFLVGVFPREMETLGLSKQGGLRIGNPGAELS